MQWNMQAGNLTTNLKVKIYFTLIGFNAIQFVTWKSFVGDSTNSR